MENRIKIGLIFLGPYPQGNVSTLRIHSYCRALVRSGYFVKVYLIAPSNDAAVNNDKKGVYEGVQYEYVTKITWSSQNPTLLIKVFYYLYGIGKTMVLLRKDKIHILLSYHTQLLSNLCFWFFSRIRKNPFILDKTEFPSSFSKSENFWSKILLFEYKLFDGIVVISQELEKFYRKVNRRIFLLPMTIDPERFGSRSKKKVKDPYIAVLFGRHNRDGVFDSVKAYHKYLEMQPTSPWLLQLIGDFNYLEDRHEIKDYIRVNNLDQKVIITGMVNNSDIPQYLLDASCLMTTPQHFNSGGFPTKLGEYMLSGTPVVVTSAGEIPLYVKHGEDVLLSEPGDIKNIASNLIQVQRDPDAAKKMGECAQKKAKTIFNAETYIEPFLNFIKSSNFE